MTDQQQIEKLLEALEEANRDFYYIHQHPEDAHTDSYGFMNKVEQVLTECCKPTCQPKPEGPREIYENDLTLTAPVHKKLEREDNEDS